MAYLSHPFVFITCLTASAMVAVATNDVPVKAKTFASPVRRIAWAGGSVAAACDAKCKDACLSAEVDGPQFGDAGLQRADACLAGCGCSGGFDHLFSFTASDGVHVSIDAGDTWNSLHEKVPAQLMQGLQYRILHAHVGHLDPRNVVLITNISTSLISNDGGSTWRGLKVGAKVGSEEPISTWQWHPTKKDMALASTRPPAATANKKSQTSRFFYTVDGGLTWKLLHDEAVQCQWAALTGGDPRRVILSVPAAPSSELVEIIASDDFLKTREVLLGKEAKDGPEVALRVKIHFNFIVAIVPIKGIESPSNPLELWVRSETLNRAATSLNGTVHGAQVGGKFRPVNWPGNVRPPLARQLRNLQVLHSSEHSLLFHLPSDQPRLPWVHVFRCNAVSNQVDLVLSDVHKPSELAGPQWRAVNGIDGVFLANRVIRDSGQDLDNVERRFDSQAVDFMADQAAESDSDLDSGVSVEGKDAADLTNMQMVVRTYLSVDSGVAWQPLQAPSSATKDTKEDFSTRLHLRQWVSSIAAPGILIGVGNTGLKLSENDAHHNVYVSRDTGLSWVQSLQGAHLVTLLSHADILVATPTWATSAERDQKSPGALKYSKDGGKTWDEVTITPPKFGMSVNALFVHPSHTGWRVFAEMSSDFKRGVTLSTLDFSSVLSADCRLGQTTDPASDFEKWSPADSLEDAHASKRPVCLFGVRTHYVRRKAERLCKTGAVHQAPLDLKRETPCNCTVTDWACDVGFARTSYKFDAPCEPLEGTLQPNVTTLCGGTLSDHVQITRGYVKVPGNQCVGGKDFSPRVEVCVANIGLRGAIRGMMANHRFSTMWLFPVLAVAAFYIASMLRPSKADGKRAKGAFEVAMSLLPARFMPDNKFWRREVSDDDEEREFLINGSCT